MDEATRQAIAQYFGIPPEAVEQTLANMFSAHPEAIQDVEAKQQESRAMFGRQMPEGQMIGRYYVPPGLGQQVAAGLERFLGAKGMVGAQGERASLLKQLREGRTAAGVGRVRNDLGLDATAPETASVPPLWDAQEGDQGGTLAELLRRLRASDPSFTG